MTTDPESCERAPLVSSASPPRWTWVGLLVGLSVCVALAGTSLGVHTLMSRTMHPADRVMLDAPVDQQVDFYAFVHIGNPNTLDDILTYPLDQLVDSPTVKGVLVMYVMNKKLFPKLLAHISKVVEDPDTPLPQELVELHKRAQGAMETANANLQPVSRIRILTPYDFEDSFLAIRHRLGAEAFEQWFGHTTYDAPKFVDALLRLRMFGNALPVLRMSMCSLASTQTTTCRISPRQYPRA